MKARVKRYIQLRKRQAPKKSEKVGGVELGPTFRERQAKQLRSLRESGGKGLSRSVIGSGTYKAIKKK